MSTRDPLRLGLRLGAATAGVLAPVAIGAMWAGVRELTDSPDGPGSQPRQQLHFLDADLVRVTGEQHDDPGWWGSRLDDPTGSPAYVRFGPPVGADLRGGTVRRYEVLEGEPPAHGAADRRRSGDGDADRRGTEGDDGPRPPERRAPRWTDRRRADEPGPWPVRGVLSPYAWPDDPQVLADRTGAEFRIDGVRVDGHTLPTWLLVPPDARDVWVVGVHGRGSSRTELFRLASTALGRGHPVLIASYRTDRWTDTPAPRTTLGMTEWRDVEAAVAACLAAGASGVVLAGCSLGGALAAATVRHSRLSPWVRGLVLDSPALHWGRVLRHTARTHRLPSGLVGPVMQLARLRARIDWAALDHLAAAEEFSAPILLLHGEEDDVVPVWLSDAFAEARPDLVSYERFPGAMHVTSWNHDRARYEAAVSAFLDGVPG